MNATKLGVNLLAMSCYFFTCVHLQPFVEVHLMYKYSRYLLWMIQESAYIF